MQSFIAYLHNILFREEVAFAQKMCRNCECSGHDMTAAGHDLSKNQCRPGSAIHGEYGSVSLCGGLGGGSKTSAGYWG